MSQIRMALCASIAAVAAALRSQIYNAIGTGMLIGAGLLTTEQGYANDRVDHTPECTLATLKGQYLFSGSGMIFAPAFGLTGTQTAVVASAGYHVFNGDGTGTDSVTFTVNGVNQNVPSPVAITYTLESDCTGTYSVQSGPKFNIFVANDGSELTVIETDSGASIAEGPSRRVRSSR